MGYVMIPAGNGHFLIYDAGIEVGDTVLLIPNYFDIYDRACIKGGDISVGDTVKTYPIKEGSRVAIKEQWSLNDKITIRGSNT